MRWPAVIGVDGGGTHSRGVLLSLEGEVLALESSGPSNYLSVGLLAAREALEALLARLRAVAHARGVEIVAAGFGLSGLDRSRDHEAFAGVLAAAGATTWPHDLLNDGFLALRAATSDGVGVAAVAGTGCNTVGMDSQGRRERVGGLAFELGDFGGAHDLGIAALRAACRGEDGRGPATALGDRLRRELGVPRLEDVLDQLSPDAATPFAPGALAPALFEVAEAGDAVAREILEHAGRELGVAARLVAERLFTADQPFPVVLGGQVLARGACAAMREALVGEVRRRFPEARPARLVADPVLGAALLAIDRLVALRHAAAPAAWPDPGVIEAARRALTSGRTP